MTKNIRWTEKFFECTDMVDSNGKKIVVKQVDQKEFWGQGKTTSDLIRDANKPVKKYAN